MHDIRVIRENPEGFEANLKRRGVDTSSVADIIALDAALRSMKTVAQDSQKLINDLSREIGLGKRTGDDTSELETRVAAAKMHMKAIEATCTPADEERLTGMLSMLPNRLADDVPPGRDETDNVVEHTMVSTFAGMGGVDHWDIPIGLDFTAGTALSGSRFTVLRGPAAKLSRALGQFMLDHNSTAGFEEVAPPVIVNTPAMMGTGQLPKFADDAYQVGDQWLIPTAEVALTNLVAGQILDEADLPLRMTALTPCFRREAGSAGRDTRGLIRQHQFEKVELVTVCPPERSVGEHERIVATAESLLGQLGLGFRRVLLCAGDTGFSAAKTFDLEVWLPGQGAYREISSCSNCHDFQSRRMDARYRPTGEKKPKHLHTLNGSALAVGRTLVALIETYQMGDYLHIPEVLRPYLSGRDRFPL